MQKSHAVHHAFLHKCGGPQDECKGHVGTRVNSLHRDLVARLERSIRCWASWCAANSENYFRLSECSSGSYRDLSIVVQHFTNILRPYSCDRRRIDF